MENRPVIMVQIADLIWTSEAMHSACALARPCGGQLALVQFVPVQYIAYLGSELGYDDYTEDDEERLDACIAIAGDYGVDYFVHLYQYSALPSAIAGAASYVGARVVFATLPASRIPFRRAVQTGALRWRLAQSNRELIDEPVSQAERLLPTLILSRGHASTAS